MEPLQVLLPSKANISIYDKEAREILRHHSNETHLRKDERWRFEFLYKVDPITETKIHQVRGKDGKVLTPYQLELELPNSLHEGLVEIGRIRGGARLKVVFSSPRTFIHYNHIIVFLA